jgi:hypothetical protein
MINQITSKMLEGKKTLNFVRWVLYADMYQQIVKLQKETTPGCYLIHIKEKKG